MTPFEKLGRALAFGFCPLLAFATGCSLLVEAETTQCVSEFDCQRLGFAGMDCVDSLCVPTEPDAGSTSQRFSCRESLWSEPGDSIDFTLSVSSLVGRTPYQGLTVLACPSLDTECASPSAQATSDADGFFTLPLEEGFRGHLYAPPPPSDPMLAPLNAHIFPPPSADPSIPVRGGLVVTSLSVVGALAEMAGQAFVPGMAHVLFTAIDCRGELLEGVAVSAAVRTQETKVFYLGDSGRPDGTLLGTGVIGQGGIANLPPGFVTIRGVHETEGVLFEQSAILAADTLTSVPIVPSPTQ